MELLSKLSRLNADYMASLMADFEQARRFIAMELQTRLGYWTQLPWVLVSFGDWKVQRARMSVAKVLKMLDESVQDVDLHHRMSWDWLSKGSATRIAFEKFRDSEPLSSFPELQYAIAELVFLPNVERDREGAHSIIKRATIHRSVSGAYVSLQLRYREI